jgi:hypothetical protein
MGNNTEFKQQIYIKMLEYKRSVGMTQWTVLSIFMAASSLMFVYGLNQKPMVGLMTRICGFLVFLLGVLLYKRYRKINQEVARFLVDLETDLELENNAAFQQRLNKSVHSSFFNTMKMLTISCVLYAILIFLVQFIVNDSSGLGFILK